MPTFATPDPIAVAIDVGVGGVRVVAGDTDETVVTVVPSDAGKPDDVSAAQATRVDFADGTLRVKGRRPGLKSLVSRGTGGSIDLTVALPAGSTVDGQTGWGDIDGEGELGDCRVKTGLGHVRLDRAGTVSVKSGMGDVTVDHARELDVATGSGDVRVRELEGGARIKNANGDIWVGGAGGDVRATAANGSIAIERSRAGLTAKSSFGDVRIGAAERGEVVVETGAGDVEVGIPAGTAAWLDVRASAGRVENLLDAADAPAAGEDTVRVRARTAVGTITVRRP